MKKYFKPETKALEIKMSGFLCLSGDNAGFEDEEYDGEID